MPSLAMEGQQTKLLDVLLVEDNPVEAMLVTSLLGRPVESPLRIQEASCLHNALAMLAATKYDVILLDLNLGDSAGYDTFARVNGAAGAAAIVVLTASDDEELALTTVREGAQDYLVKGSFDRGLLVRAVRYAVERKRSKDALRQSQASARAMFESSLDGIVICDNLARCLEVNAAAAALLAQSTVTLVGRDLFEFADAGFETQWRRLLAEGSGRARFTAIRHDGEKRLVDFSLRARIFPGQHLCVLRDVTEQQGLEEQVRQSQKLEAVGRLAGGVAHDFNNLLGVIRGHAELLQVNAGEPAQAARAEKIISATERGAALTRQLLAFGRKEVVAPELLDVPAVLMELKPMLTCLMAPECQVEIRSEAGLRLVRADRAQLEQIAVNIAANARDAMLGGGTLDIAVGNYDNVSAHEDLPEGKYVRIAFKDTGIGMDQATQLRIFEPFFTTKKMSSGLGLSTVYGIVQQSGGHISVDSAPMKGTTLIVYLPMVAPGSPDRHAKTQQTGDLRGDETILLADDEDDLRSTAAEYLERLGYHVLLAANGTEAIAIADGFPGKISLLISDIMMPNVNGPALVSALRKKRPGTPVMVISGFAHDAMRNHQGIMNSAFFLQKPFTLHLLATKVRALLDGNEPSAADRPWASAGD